MREIRPSGSEGGARGNPLLLPYPFRRMRQPWHPTDDTATPYPGAEAAHQAKKVTASATP